MNESSSPRYPFVIFRESYSKRRVTKTSEEEAVIRAALSEDGKMLPQNRKCPARSELGKILRVSPPSASWMGVDGWEGKNTGPMKHKKYF